MANRHPKGLYPLFFTEMWERLAFYLMLGILFLYLTDRERGGLGLTTGQAGEIFGTYLAFVYFTPFLGGMIADRVLGYRRSILLGGVLMALGYFSLGIRSLQTLYIGLVLICLGNGFFKPNISTMVGNLYEAGDPRRDAGFNIFYMGINIGAAVSALVATPIRNLWNFNYAFVAAGIGLLVGVAILLSHWKPLERGDRKSQPAPGETGLKEVALVILLPALLFGILGYFLGTKVKFLHDTLGGSTTGFLLGVVPIIGYFVYLARTAEPEERPGLSALMPVFLAGATFFMILHLSGGLFTIWARDDTNRVAPWLPFKQVYAQVAMPSYYFNAAPDVPRPREELFVDTDDRTATLFGAKILTQQAVDRILAEHPDLRAADPESTPMELDWQALVCKIYDEKNVKIKTEKDAHGHETLSVQIEPETAVPLGKVIFLRSVEGRDAPVFLVTPEVHRKVFANAAPEARLPAGKFLKLANPELITGLFNPLFVVLLTPLVVGFFGWLMRRGIVVSTARKIFYGMCLTAAALGIMALAAWTSQDGAYKVSAWWMILAYLVVTTGELCLSPMGLSLVTKLSPARYAGLMMGGWFLATAIGSKLSGFISGLEPTTNLFVVLVVATLAVAGFLFLLLPWLERTLEKYGA
ncbi:MAG: MFS transporter [Acidobacteria bacterium]|nr:MAG: MFS transporter [Acidobacteriota bacterium]